MITGGHLFGAAQAGGGGNGGTLFELAANGPPPWQIKIPYSFCQVAGCADGARPLGPLIPASKKFYGVASAGGAHAGGTVFEISP